MFGKSGRDIVNSYLKKMNLLPLNESNFASFSSNGIPVGITVMDNALIINSIFMPIPQNNVLPLYRKLLSLNYLFATTFHSFFSINREKNLIVINAKRAIDGLDFDEFVKLVNSVSLACKNLLPQVKSELGI
jgi:hypothetical protein